MSKNEEATPKKIVVEYEDGTVKELGKGLVFRIEEDAANLTAKVTAELVGMGRVVGMSGRDLYMAVGAAFELGMRLGMFDDKEGTDNEES